MPKKTHTPIKVTEKELREAMENAIIENNPFEATPPLTYDYLIDRHKDLPDEYLTPTDIPYSPDERAVTTPPSLNEGLIKTYPTKKTIEYVCTTLTKKGYPISPDNFNIDSPNNDNTIYGHITLQVQLSYLNKEIDDTLKQEFNLCGYHLGATFNRMDSFNNPCVVYQFEPLFQDNNTNLTLGRYLYHVTTETAARKILKNGFSPSNRGKNIFKYSPRNYFFTVYSENGFRDFMHQAGKQSDKLSVITVDRDRCPDTRFFTDPNFDNGIAVFTYENIPPSAIKSIKNI